MEISDAAACTNLSERVVSPNAVNVKSKPIKGIVTQGGMGFFLFISDQCHRTPLADSSKSGFMITFISHMKCLAHNTQKEYRVYVHQTRLKAERTSIQYVDLTK